LGAEGSEVQILSPRPLQSLKQSRKRPWSARSFSSCVYRNASLQPASCNAPCAASSSAAYTSAGVLWVNEQQEHLAFSRMDGSETDDIAQFIDGDKQHVRRRMFDHELVPLVRRKHRFPSELSEVRPPVANGRIEHGRSSGRRWRRLVEWRSRRNAPKRKRPARVAPAFGSATRTWELHRCAVTVICIARRLSCSILKSSSFMYTMLIHACAISSTVRSPQPTH
jgi:hypothetical protein